MSTNSSVLAHHFDNIQQQQSVCRLGMWFFLVTEILFFGGIFGAYTVYRIWFPKEFAVASSKLNLLIAGINSLILLTSSLTITLAIHAAHEGKQQLLKRYLLVTMFLGCAFLAFKAREYYVDYKENLLPGPGFNVHHFHEEIEKEHISVERVQLFFLFYYCMTGLHVLHMLVGIGAMAWLYFLATRGYFLHTERYVFIEVTSLYWHFVDMMWFFLLALLYLAGHQSLDHLHF